MPGRGVARAHALGTVGWLVQAKVLRNGDARRNRVREKGLNHQKTLLARIAAMTPRHAEAQGLAETDRDKPHHMEQ